MFSSITIRRQDITSERPLDIGYLLECLLFYRNVTVVADPAILKQLLVTFGVKNLESLLTEGALQITYTEDFFGIQSKKVGSREYYHPILGSAPRLSLQNELPKLVKEMVEKEGKARRIALSLRKYMSAVNHDRDFIYGTQAVIANSELISRGVRVILHHLVPEFPEKSDIIFRTEKAEAGFVVETNLDFGQLNSFYHKRVSVKHSSLNPAYLLALICGADAHLYFAGRKESELAIDPVGADLVACRFHDLAQRSRAGEDARKEFAALIFRDARALAEAFNQNSVSIDQATEVILASGKFKDWLSGQPPDANLVHEYYRKVTAETFVDKLPGKTVRWSIFAGLGLATEAVFPSGVGIAASLGLSALDSFFVDKIAKGWKPNQFIEDKLLPLLQKEIN